jgi:hypothetical protein
MIDVDQFDLYLAFRARAPGKYYFGTTADSWDVLWTALAFATRL